MTRSTGKITRRPARCPHCDVVLQVGRPARASCDVYPTHPRGVPPPDACAGSLDQVEPDAYLSPRALQPAP